ncbi:NIPSNAP family protein [Mumia sp. DW29H23]|uniref:NIPSNAP family protein n=1 Tax=Mumia sp. DW29H23 TaxID=3421241 RepID=UPI003D682F17
MAARTALVELRRYVLRPGERETLIRLFEADLVAPQEEAGMSVLGQFRDLDRPDAFVWLRGFDDPASRGASLRAFYGGPAWARHRDAANATMLAWDDVLLLRPVAAGALPVSAPAGVGGLVVVTLYRPDDLDGFAMLMADGGDAALAGLGSARVAAYASADVVNAYPALPVREDVRAYVRVARFASEADHATHVRRLGSAASSDRVLAALRSAAVEELRLVPTEQSAFR